MIKRTITSIAILAFILPIIILGDEELGGTIGQSFFLGMMIILSFYAAYEINAFLLVDKLRVAMASSILTGIVMNLFLLSFFGPMIYNMHRGADILPIDPKWFLSFISFALLPILFSFNRDNKKRLLQISLILLYMFWSFSFVYLNFVYGVAALFYPIIITVCVDIFGYFIGSSIGRHKIVPKISPNKTWEGTIGAIIISVSIGTIFAIYTVFMEKLNSWSGKEINTFIIFIITLLLSITSFFGDLFFSYVKRIENKKDYGTILPGHGGLLDRIDGHIFTTSLFFILMVVIY